MFKLRRPCKTCPFRIGVGSGFNLRVARLAEIKLAPAFQCHGTVDYESGPEDENGFPKPQPGDTPQQCAGLMAVLHREGEENQIMQVASRMGALDLSRLDPDGEAYRTWAQVIRAHRDGKEPRQRILKVNIRINGLQVEVTESKLTYEDIVGLADKSGTPSMTWHRPGEAGGIIIPGQTVNIREGMSFSVHHTGNA